MRFTVDELVALKVIRTSNCVAQRCQSRVTKGHLCGRCRRLSQKLCRAYHNVGSLPMELEGRIAYEYVFDVLDLDDITNATWLAPDKRDEGHTRRLVNITRKLVAQNVDMDWLNAEMALRKAVAPEGL